MVVTEKVDNEESEKEGEKNGDHRPLGKHGISDGNGKRGQMNNLSFNLNAAYHKKEVQSFEFGVRGRNLPLKYESMNLISALSFEGF